MCFDLEECSDIFCALFQLIFKIVKYVMSIFLRRPCYVLLL